VNDRPADKHKSRRELSQHQPLPQKKHQQSSKITACKKQHSNDSTAQGATNSNSKVIIDVACCDGPVRFHRVLNDNYGLTLDDILAGDTPEENTSRHDPTHEPLRNNQDLGHVSHIYKPTASSTSLSHPQPEDKEESKLNENTNEQLTTNEVSDEHTKGDAEHNATPKQQPVISLGESDDDQKAGNAVSSGDRNTSCKISELQDTDRNNKDREESSAPNLSDGNTSSSSASVASEKVSSSLETVYTCLYCNHTFKSHYCYQKHARRHINPVTIDLSRLTERLGTNKGIAVCKILGSEKDKANGSGSVRREVRLLDMNVQYYPCKTCGSKFPSYYFVHKHRKMCHANEESESLVGSEESHSQSQTSTSA
jgi:hypothetical protein